MAKVSLTLKCSECGKEFLHTHTCRNSKEAEEYTTWAEENVDLCPKCWYNQKLKEQGLIGRFCFNYKEAEENPNDKSKHLILVAEGDSYSYKEELEKLGFRFGFLDNGKESKKSWHFVLPYDKDEIRKVSDAFKDIGGKVVPPDYSDVRGYQKILKKATELEEKLKELGPCPPWSEEVKNFLGSKKWNGKIYGKREKTVYLDNEKTVVPPELLEKLEQELAARAEWQDKKAKILEVIKSKT